MLLPAEAGLDRLPTMQQHAAGLSHRERPSSPEYASFIRSLYVSRYGMPEGFHRAEAYLASRNQLEPEAKAD